MPRTSIRIRGSEHDRLAAGRGGSSCRRPPPPQLLLRSAAGAGDEVAPLGGVVQSIHVNVGQVVNEGDKLVSLEAMKMVTHVVAHRGGKVTNIAVKPGDPVDAGQVLLTIG